MVRSKKTRSIWSSFRNVIIHRYVTRRKKYVLFQVNNFRWIGKKENQTTKETLERLISPDSYEAKKYFVTLGFKHDIQIADFKKWIEKWIQKDMVIKLKGKFEMHIDNGLQHPHFHMEIQIDHKKSKVIQYIWQSAGIKKLMESQSFIDVKPFQDYHEDYLDGLKTTEKMDNVQKDETFRKKHDIPEFYIK